MVQGQRRAREDTADDIEMPDNGKRGAWMRAGRAVELLDEEDGNQGMGLGPRPKGYMT